ncbi:MAG: hypothetical protein ACKV2T_08295 [Kofleriaceae bacterium]
MALGLMVGCSGDAGDEDEPRPRLTPCEQLRDHLIDLRLADAVNVDKKAHRESLRTAMGANFVESCSKLGDDAIRCAMQANDSTTAAACAGTTTENR